MTEVKNKVLLVVLDGFGEAPDPDPRPKGNAINLAKTPTFDRFKKEHPSSLVEACGEAVGLVKGGMGGSEIGHFSIGAGRVFPQSLLQINWSIQDGSFFQNKAMMRAIKQAGNKGSSLHLLGMISDAGVHSQIDHVFALLELVKKNIGSIERCFLHCIADGRDVQPQSVSKYIKMIEAKIHELELEKKVVFGTIVGRFYAMDRDQNWDRTEVAYKLLTQHVGDNLESCEASFIEQRVNEFYASAAKEKSDYYLPPIVCHNESRIKENDGVIFFNYRTDRPRQLTEAFEQEKFESFDRSLDPKKLTFTTFGPYSDLHTAESPTVAFPIPQIENNLGSWLSQKGVPQLRIAETEKYAHVTYFFNSQKEAAYDKEDRVMVPSKKCNHFGEIPEMSAREVTDEVEKALAEKKHDIIIVNYANADLVGHTGKLDPTITAVEVLDECMKRLETSSKENGFIFILTADHGNAEDMMYDDGSEKMSHSMNKVMFMVAHHPESESLKLSDGGLADVAPTVLDIMGIEKPAEMTGKSLLM